ncbi:hypothetical protein LCGC14_3159710 [marine sediment metagenome]|uniref:Uncharacterized protein n=1 Tax=marine sediment metagenome TaxID=412755 RepID=A0A0F8V6P5_9ZZZZ
MGKIKMKIKTKLKAIFLYLDNIQKKEAIEITKKTEKEIKMMKENTI